MINSRMILLSTGVLLVSASLLTSSNVQAQADNGHQQNTQEETKSPKKTAHGDMDHSKISSEEMDHSKMNHEKMPEGEMNHAGIDHSKMGSEEMDHSKMNHEKIPESEMDHAGMDHSKMGSKDMGSAMDHNQMKHGDMQAQGGDAPANARDPHAYSSGYTLTQGPYALNVPTRLTLADEHSFWSVLGDRLEYNNDENSTVYDLQGWYGTTFDRAVFKAEGDILSRSLLESQTELLWSHAVSAFWDSQLGVKFDQYDQGQNRRWLAFGFQGLAPYWFEVDVSAYLGENGRTAISAEAEYELLITQRWVLQSRIEMSLNGKDDEINGVGKGLSSLSTGIRLRYEFSRQLAPYIGIEWSRKFGNTADYARAENEEINNTSLVAGLRFWF